jgi:hypothetical protein
VIDVKIGVSQHPHEIDLELEQDSDELMKTIDEAVSAEKPMVWLKDTKGQEVGVPSAKIAFVEIRTADASKRVGFGV